MNALPPNRRRDARYPVELNVDLLVGDRMVPCTMNDLSNSGAQIAVDPDAFDFTGTHIDAVYIDKKRVGIEVCWALYDGTVGIAFTDHEAAEPVLTPILPN